MTTTPPRAVLPPEQNQSLSKNTSWSTSSASYESSQAQNTQKHYKPYLAASIASAITIPFKDFLYFAFDFALDPPTADANWREICAIATSRCCQALLDEYKDEVSHETERYHTFNNLANHIITKLDKRCPSQAKPIIVLCCNYHVPVEGSSSAAQIPDCVIVPESAVDHGERTSCLDSLSKDGRPTIDQPFHRCELLAFVQFKLEERLLHSPPSVSSTEATTATGLPSLGTSGSLRVKKSSGQSSSTPLGHLHRSRENIASHAHFHRQQKYYIFPKAKRPRSSDSFAETAEKR